MTQKLVTQALALGSALDQAGNIGNRKAQIPVTHHSQIGRERRKRVISNLGARGRHAGDERALAHRRHAHKRGVGHELHLELDPERLGWLAQLGERGRTPRRRDEMHVATATAATLGNDHTFAVVGEVGDFLARLQILVEQAHDRANGHPEDEVLAICAMHALALAMRTLLRLEMVLVAIVDERGNRGVRNDDDVTTAATIAAVRATLGNMGLATKRGASGTAVARFDLYANLVGEGPRHVRSP